MKRRRNPRFRSDLVTLFAVDGREGSGVLAEVSYSSARLEETSLRPRPGARVQLQIVVQPIEPFTLRGRVARLTESGFAIHTDVFDDEVRRLVDDVAAIVEAPRSAAG